MKKALLLMALMTSSVKAFEIDYQINYVDSYSSQHQMFKRDMCGQASQTIRLQLSLTERKELETLLNQADFFALQTDQRQYPSSGNGLVTVCSPCMEPELSIKQGHRSKRVIWNCDCEDGEFIPEPLEPLVSRLKTILESKEVISQLEPSNCRFY